MLQMKKMMKWAVVLSAGAVLLIVAIVVFLIADFSGIS
jgi:hypothetical protein